MINLTGKDLSGLARGVEMFKSVKRADERLNAGAEGFRGLAHIDPEEAKSNSTSSRLDEAHNYILDLSDAYSAEEAANAAVSKFGISIDEANKIAKDLIKRGYEFSNSDKKSEYPHDIFENKSDGLKRGSGKYGEFRNGWQCLECGRKFASAASAEKAASGNSGCPGCGGSDIDFVSDK